MGRACDTDGRDKKDGAPNLVGKPEGRDDLKGLGVDTRMILKCTLEKQDGRLWTGFVWSSGGCCDHDSGL